MSGAVRLAFFILVSAGAHAAVLLEVGPRLRSGPPRRVRTTVVPIPRERLAAPDPARATALPRSRPAANTRQAPGRRHLDPGPLPRLTRVARGSGVDRGRSPVEGTKPTPPAARPRPTPAGRVQTPFATREAYLARLGRLADRAPRTGAAVPDLVTDDGLDFEETLDVIRFYGMRVVVYPLPRDGASPTYYVELTGEALDTATRRTGPASLAGFSSRARDLTGHPAFWRVLARVAARHHFDPYHALIAAVVPERVDRYFLWKQARAAARAGLPLGAVRATRGRFRRTNVGWMLAIYAVAPRRGPAVRIAARPEEEWE